MGFIYIIKCSQSPKVYIGQTTEKLLCNRWKTHRHVANLYIKMKDTPELKDKINGGNSHLYNAMAKYGLDNFTIEYLIKVEDNSLLNDLEEKYIKEYNSIQNGFNIRSGGNRTEHSEETKSFISERTKEAFNKIEVVKNLRKHHDKLEGLPPKCTYGFNNKQECYRIRRHPLCKDKSFYIKKYGSIEECKKAIMEFMKNLEENANKDN